MKIIATVPFMTSKKDFLDAAGNFIQQWDAQKKAGKTFAFSHIFVIGTVFGHELKTMAFVLAENETETIDTMKDMLMQQLYQVNVHILTPSQEETKTLSLTRTMFGQWDEKTKKQVADQLGISLEEIQEMFESDLALDNLYKVIQAVNTGK